MAAVRPLNPLPEEVPARSPWRAIKYSLIALAATLLLGAVIALVWAAGRYQQGVELARKAREQYGALNAQFPFATPKPGQATGGGRWTALLAAREQIRSAAVPELRRLLVALLDARSLSNPEVYRQLLAGVPLLDELLAGQLAALRREQMSAREYQWLLGLAIAAAMENPARCPAGQVYWAVLGKLERLTKADGNAGNDMEARQAYAFFRKAYPGAAGPGAEVLGGLACQDEAEGALDLLLAAAQWEEGEGGAAEGALKELVTKR